MSDNHSVRPNEIRADPFERRRRWQRRLQRIGLPIVGVAMMIGAILAIAVYSDQANRAGVLGLSNDLLSELDGRIEQQVSSYVDPAGRAMAIINDTLAGADPDHRGELFVRVAASALHAVPHIAQFLWADPEGNFLQVRRGQAGTVEYKRIVIKSGNREVEWIRLDSNGNEISRTADPADTYDPRQRPWYTGAMRTDGIAWTGVYIFFTDRDPGITASRMHASRGGRVEVFGADIKLEALSRFLQGLKIGANGHALIFDDNGTLVALPDMKRMLRREGDTVTAACLDQLDDPVLLAAYDRYRVEGYGRRIISVGDKRYISMFSQVPGAGSGWTTMIVVPEDDFTGFIKANQRVALAMSLTIVALAAVLAGLLVAQGLRADRIARELLEHSQAITRQSAAFGTLATEVGLFDPSSPEVSGRIAEIIANACDARRASIWSVVEGGGTIRCEDSYEQESGGHTVGLELVRADAPQLFAELLNGGEVSVGDVMTDPSASPWMRAAMRALGTTTLLAVPIRGPSGVVGAIWLEDAETGTQDFARAVANMLALRMSGGGLERAPDTPRVLATVPDVVPAPPQPLASGPETAVKIPGSFEAELLARGLDATHLAAEVFTDVAVLVLQFGNSAALAAPIAKANDDPGQISLADRIACALQEAAETGKIPYLKLYGRDAVAAAGVGGRDADGVVRIAGLAITLRDTLFDLFDKAGQAPDFRIGLSFGIAVGSHVGREPRVYNVWGEAVELAVTMANAAGPGAVLATEAAYARLTRNFLFRPRGRFWLPRVGESRIFALVGRT